MFLLRQEDIAEGALAEDISGRSAAVVDREPGFHRNERSHRDSQLRSRPRRVRCGWPNLRPCELPAWSGRVSAKNGGRWAGRETSRFATSALFLSRLEGSSGTLRPRGNNGPPICSRLRKNLPPQTHLTLSRLESNIRRKLSPSEADNMVLGRNPQNGYALLEDARAATAFAVCYRVSRDGAWLTDAVTVRAGAHPLHLKPACDPDWE